MDLHWILHWTSSGPKKSPLDPPVEDQNSSGPPLEIQSSTELFRMGSPVNLHGYCPPDVRVACSYTSTASQVATFTSVARCG